MTYADSTERAALISGLRGLADYLESNPEVPAPIYSAVLHVPAATATGRECAPKSTPSPHGSASSPT